MIKALQITAPDQGGTSMTNVVQFSGTSDGADRKKAARAQLVKVKSAARKAVEAVEEFTNAVKLFHLEGYWLELGYANPAECYRTELAPFLPGAVGPVRSQLFGTFKELGMSNVEIAAATGVSEFTVRNDARSSSSMAIEGVDHGPGGEPDETDASDQAIEASDWPVSEPGEPGPMDDTGEAYAEPDETVEVEIVEVDETDEIIDAEIVEESPGKPQAPAALLIDRTDKIIAQIDRLTDQLEKLAADKRWPGERRKILARMKVGLGQLGSALDVVQAK
jgi:hypothetical protein